MNFFTRPCPSRSFFLGAPCDLKEGHGPQHEHHDLWEPPIVWTEPAKVGPRTASQAPKEIQ